MASLENSPSLILRLLPCDIPCVMYINGRPTTITYRRRCRGAAGRDMPPPPPHTHTFDGSLKRSKAQVTGS